MKQPFAFIHILLLVTCAYANAAVVLQYHHVSDDTPTITSISPKDFHAHMDYLHEKRFNVISIEQLIKTLDSNQTIPDKSVVITFDDAYRDIIDNAVPTLKHYGFPATIFVATSLVGSSSYYLDWAQLRHLQDSGFTMANHTVTHTHLLQMQPNENKKMWLQRLTKEIEDAQKDLKKHLGVTQRIFAYTYGEYDRDVANLVRKLGYIAFGQQSGPIGQSADTVILPRFPLSGAYTDLSEFRTKVATIAFPLEDRFIDPVTTESRPRLKLKLVDKNKSLAGIACYGPGGPMHIEHVNAQAIITTSVKDIPVGRSRYNCTLRHPSGRYYWFSQTWIHK